jgi:aminopeptidase N
MSSSAVRENLTRSEARDRAATISEVHARVHLDLTDGAETFEATTHLRFQVVGTTSTFVDLTAAEVHGVVLDGSEVPASAVQPTRILLDDLATGDHELRVVSTMRYQNEGNGLHRFVDPADGRVYLHSQFQPFDAHLVYACFDQPDLRTVFELTVEAPEEWVVVSNQAAALRPAEGEAGRWSFPATPPIPSYITAVVAGSYTNVHDRYVREDGSEIPLGVYVRRSLADHLDADEILEITRQGFGYFEDAFGHPYPFDKYDQLFVPEFSAGAMENPGCVTFSETYVFRSKVTDTIRERRGETILHEMAHMWFGDLVTMRWWDDLWLNESFATFMAVLCQAEATRWQHAFVTFSDMDKTWAKLQDQLPSTHPIAADMPDIESVHQNFDGITYAKGASVLRQLVAWVGQEEFLAGCRVYFQRHAWGNTELTDFLTALEEASGRDLAAWRDEWLLTTGVTTLRAEFELSADGTYSRVAVHQDAEVPSWSEIPGVEASAPAPRRHRVAVGVYDRTSDGLIRRESVEFDLAGEHTEVAKLAGMRPGDLLLLNDEDLTYAKVAIDGASMRVLADDLHRLVDPMPRSLVWGAAWDMVRDAKLPARRFLELFETNVDSEQIIGVLQRLMLRAIGAAERFVAPTHRAEALSRLAVHARRQLERAEPGSDQQLAWVRHWATVARGHGSEMEALKALFDGTTSFPGLTVDTDLRWHLVVSLAGAGAIGEDDIASELAADDTDLGRRHAATARAARPDRDAKAWAWRTLLEDRSLSHTMSRQIWGGFVQLDQTEVLAPYVEAYFAALDEVWERRSLDWAISFSNGMFPHFGASEELVATVDARLSDDGLPGPLRRVLLEQRDAVVRMLVARELDAAVD